MCTMFERVASYFLTKYLGWLVKGLDADKLNISIWGGDVVLHDLELQEEALDFLEAVCERPSMHVEFRQEPGDILLLNNWITYHRRNAFQDHENIDQRRHLLRIWLAMPNSRPLDPAFLTNYGAIQAGAIRGGMKSKVQ